MAFGALALYIPGILSRGKKKTCQNWVILYKKLPIPPVHLENQNNPLIGPTSWRSPSRRTPQASGFWCVPAVQPKESVTRRWTSYGEKPHTKWRWFNRKNVPWQMHRSVWPAVGFLGCPDWPETWPTGLAKQAPGPANPKKKSR